MNEAPSWQMIFGMAPNVPAEPVVEPLQEKQPVSRQWPELLTIREAAEYLNIGHTTLYNWIRSGTFPIEPVIAGKKQIRIARRRLENWLAGGAIVHVSAPAVPVMAMPAQTVWLR